jgi:hypothetical protein
LDLIYLTHCDDDLEMGKREIQLLLTVQIGQADHHDVSQFLKEGFNFSNNTVWSSRSPQHFAVLREGVRN